MKRTGQGFDRFIDWGVFTFGALSLIVAIALTTVAALADRGAAGGVSVAARSAVAPLAAGFGG